MLPEELLAVLDAIPGVRLTTSWLCETGEVELSKVFVAFDCDMTPGPDEFEFVVRIERGTEDGHPERSDLPSPEPGGA